MKFQLLLASLAVAPAVLAAPQVPTYTALNLSSIVSDGLFHGNAVLADVNNDGNFNLIAKGRDLNNGWATTLKVLSGDGFGFNSAADIADPDGCSWERVIVPIDFNADGNMDLILASSWNAKLLQGDGTGNFTLVDTQIFNLDGEISIDGDDSEKWYTGLMAVADFNCDGYPDIVTFCGNPREDQGEPVLFINKGGSGEFTRSYGVGLLPQRGGTIAVGDFNRDGAPDLAVSGWNDDKGNDCIRLYANNGSGTFTEVASADFDNAQAGSEKGQIIFADVDGDGWLDLFVTGESCPQGWAKHAALSKNTEGKSFARINTTLPGVKASGADWCDVNGDGNMDLVYAGEGDEKALTVLAVNQGDGTFVTKADLMEGHRGGAALLAADFNNNGVPDVTVMGYNDGGAHFQLYNGLCSRGINAAPTAPSNLKAVADGDKTTFSWSAASDAKTPAEALRYNLLVKTKDGKTFAFVPADFATGKLRCADVNAATTALTYTMAVKLDDIEEWGVQAIDGGKLAGEFAKAITTGVASVNTDSELKISFAAGAVSVNAQATVSVSTLAGATIWSGVLEAGETLPVDLYAGVYVVKAVAASSSAVLKIVK